MCLYKAEAEYGKADCVILGLHIDATVDVAGKAVVRSYLSV